MISDHEQSKIESLCEVLGAPRSSAYDHPQPSEDRLVRGALIQLAGQWATRRSRRLPVQLKRQGLLVGSQVVRRLMHDLGIAGGAHVCEPRTTDSEHVYGIRIWSRVWR